MAKNDIGGVWRTIGGRRVFIKDGQDLASAMKESGKFNRKKLTRKEKEAEYELYKKARQDENSIDPMTENSTDWEALDKKYKERYEDETNPKISIKDDKGNRETIRANELKEKAKKEWQENEEKIKGMTDKLGIGEDNQKWLTEKELSPKEINSLQHEARKLRNEAEKTTGKDSDEAWKKFDDINDKLGEDRIDKRYDTEFYNNEIDKISKMDSLDDRKQAIRRLEERTGTDRKVIQDALDEKDYDKHLGEEYERRFGKEKEEKKTTNEIMNEKIRTKANKNTFEEDLPKRTEIKTQGTSNRKEVSENIQAHILEHYDKPEDFIEQMDAYDWKPTMWQRGEALAEDGFYEIYYDDQRQFLEDLKINPKGRKFSNDIRVFQTYKSLIGRESAKLYDRIQKNSYKKYLKAHPLSKMSFEEFKDMNKK